MSESECIFCKIVRKEAPASILYEDAKSLAFMDIHPVSEGHTLIIPKQHYVDIFDVPEETLAAVHMLAKKIAVAVKEAIKADGISIVQQSGKAAGQDIFHLHAHVIPRFQGVKMYQFEKMEEIERADLELAAKKIRRQL